MAASQPLIIEDVLDAYPISRHHMMLDVGGGTGTFVRMAAARASDLRFQLFDLPDVCTIAKTKLPADVLARCEIVGGDFQAGALPEGADLASMIRVAFDHDDGTVIALMTKVRQALAPGGRLLLAEPMARTGRPDPIADAYYGFYLMAMGRGRPRTPEQLITLMKKAGFRNARESATRRPMLAGLIVADSKYPHEK